MRRQRGRVGAADPARIAPHALPPPAGRRLPGDPGGRTGPPPPAGPGGNDLRLTGAKGEARASFLFASAPQPGKPADRHRRTTTAGFAPGGRHHVAVSYTFGQPRSIRGFIGGKAVPGTWDMGGATARAPVTDADDPTIWRTALPASTPAARYQSVPPPPVVRKEALPRGGVRRLRRVTRPGAAGSRTGRGTPSV